jgi:hypothetical protein
MQASNANFKCKLKLQMLTTIQRGTTVQRQNLKSKMLKQVFKQFLKEIWKGNLARGTKGNLW